MAKLKNYSGADMSAKDYNDVYGVVNLDYTQEFTEFNAEQVTKELKEKQCQKECNNELDSGGCQGS